MASDGTITHGDDGWEHVGTGQTNTVAGSVQDITVDFEPICQNLSNKEFRALIMRLRDAAVLLIQDRIRALTKWDHDEQECVKTWFGRADETTRNVLVVGLPKLLRIMQDLKPENVIRWDEQKQRNITCAVFPDNGYTDAAVCKPDSGRHVIAIYPHFCTLPDTELWRECKLKTLIHECTHFTDTFNSDDVKYGTGIGLAMWAKSESDGAIKNADSIAAYVAQFDKKLWG